MILTVDDASQFKVGDRLSIDWYESGYVPNTYIVVGIKGNEIEVAETYSQ